MTFCQAVDAVPVLAGTCLPGLRALGKHSNLVRATAPTGSIDIDAALRPSQPNAHRYDYGVGLPPKGRARNHRAVWIEVHSAHTSEVSVMLRKQATLAAWLNSNAPDLARMTIAWLWIPSGNKVAIPKTTPQYRRLASSRVRLVPSPCDLDRL